MNNFNKCAHSSDSDHYSNSDLAHYSDSVHTHP